MFLYRKENALSSEVCDAFIQSFEASEEKQPGMLYDSSGYNSSGGKKSTDLTFNPTYLQHPVWGSLLSELVAVIEKGKQDYINRHSEALNKVDPLILSPLFNLQRYLPNEGFTSWHCERATNKYSRRTLVWMLYLNTVSDRGETEFLYQHHFEQPVKGTLLVWPSDWMYTHRGVSSPTETKYILTGWFEMADKP